MKKMSVYSLCIIALLASLEYVSFVLFSNFLYLEVITFLVVFVAMMFDLKESVFSSLIFALILILIQGFTFWNGMYLVIYPLYSFIISISKNFLHKHVKLLSVICGILSFLTGQLLQLPFLLVNKNVTIYYILAGLKTSLVQGVVSGILCYLLFESLKKRIGRMIR